MIFLYNHKFRKDIKLIEIFKLLKGYKDGEQKRYTMHCNFIKLERSEYDSNKLDLPE